MNQYTVDYGYGASKEEFAGKFDKTALDKNGNEAVMHPYDFCQYMSANVVDINGRSIELYAQLDPYSPEYEDDLEMGGYCDLKREIIRQAEEKGIDPECLEFCYG